MCEVSRMFPVLRYLNTKPLGNFASIKRTGDLLSWNASLSEGTPLAISGGSNKIQF